MLTIQTSDKPAPLYKALVAAQGAMPNATLNKENPHFKSKYSDLTALREATLPALTKHGIGLVQCPNVDDAGNLLLITRLIHESGEWMEGAWPVPVYDKPQAMGSALTYARRYCWAAMCGIAAEEDDDANAAQAAEARKARAASEGALPNPGAFIEQKLKEAAEGGAIEDVARVWAAQAPTLKRLGKPEQDRLAAIKDKLKFDLTPDAPQKGGAVQVGDVAKNVLAGG